MMVPKDDIARKLADAHFNIEPGITRIFQLRDQPEQEARPETPIKLLEVNETTVSAGVIPLYFSAVPASGIPYPSVIIEVTPDEYEKIRGQELSLPHGWFIGGEIAKGSG